jgi:NADH-quinone oxidoreductase subunit J
MGSQVIFYGLSAFLLGAALMAVVSKKIFRSAIWLLLSLTGVAGIYFWMQVEFIAAVQIVVYVGGIVVLIIFSIFLTQESGKELPDRILSVFFFLPWQRSSGWFLAITLYATIILNPLPKNHLCFL